MSNEMINEINEMNFIDSLNFISGFIDDIEYIRGLKNIIYDDPHTDHTLMVIKNKLENKKDNLKNIQERIEQLSRRPDVTAVTVENLKRFYAYQNIVLINKCISFFNEISGNIHFPEGFNKKELLKTLFGGEGESEILSSVSDNNINQNEVGESTTQNFDANNSFIGGYFELPEGNDVDMQNSSESNSTIDGVVELYGGDETNLSQLGEQIWGNNNDRQPIDNRINTSSHRDEDLRDSSNSPHSTGDASSAVREEINYQPVGNLLQNNVNNIQSNDDSSTQNDNHSRNNDTRSDFSAISSIPNVNNEEHYIDDSYLHQSYSDVLPASINNSYQRGRSTSREIFKFKNIKNAFKRCLCFKQ